MDKKVKGILVGGVALVLLAGALVTLKLTEDMDTAESNSSSSEESVSSEAITSLLYEKAADMVQSVSIQNETGSWTVVREQEATDSTSAVYGVPELEGLPLNQSVLTGLVNKAASLTSRKTIEENPSDLSKYGLDQPGTVITVTFSDGTSQEVSVGAEAPTSGQVYVLVNGTVYTAYTANFTSVQGAKETALDLSLVPAMADAENPDKVDKVTFQRDDVDWPVVISYNEESERTEGEDAVLLQDSHVFTAPVSARVNGNNKDTLVNGMFGLTAGSAYLAFPTAEQKAALGLSGRNEVPADSFGEAAGQSESQAVSAAENDETEDSEAVAGNGKQCYVQMESKGNTYSLLVGDQTPDGASYYVMLEGRDVVYTVAAESMPWFNLPENKLLSSLIASMYIYTLDTVDLMVDGQEYHFDCEGSNEENFVVKVNGQEISLENFQNMYQYLLSAPAEEFWLNEPASEQPVAFIHYKTQDGRTTDIDFYASEDERRSIIKVNGVTSFRCRSTYLTRLGENIKLLLEGEPIISYW